MRLIFFVLLMVQLAVGLGQEAAAQSDNIYEFNAGPKFLHTKNYFYDNGEEVIVFDAQLTPELAKKSIEFIQTKTKNPITWVVVLQPSLDKFGGISAFQKIGAKVLTSKPTADTIPDVHTFRLKFYTEGMGKSFGFTNYTWPSQFKIDSVFEGSHNLTLKNGQKIVLRDLSNPGPATNHSIAYIAEEDAIFVSDLISYQSHANWEGALEGHKAVPKINGWLANLNELNKIFKKNSDLMVYPGRGKAVELPSAVWEEIRYLKGAYQVITYYYKGNRRRWSSNAVIPENIYQEFLEEMERAFPGYQLPELTRTALWPCWECDGAEKLK